MEEQELLWRQYSQNVDLYKFYMDLLIKFNIFYYAITGGLLSFYFSNLKIENIKYSLLLPFIMSICFAIFFIYGSILMKFVRLEVFRIRDQLGFIVAPDVGVLSVLLRIFSFVFLLVAFGCGYIIWKT